jgi:hypothetical protein
MVLVELAFRLTYAIKRSFCEAKIWGKFAGFSLLIAVICPEPKAKVCKTWRGAERSEHRRVPEVAEKLIRGGL